MIHLEKQIVRRGEQDSINESPSAVVEFETAGTRPLHSVLKCRAIGEWYADRMRWGVELYWNAPDGTEQYRRTVAFTENEQAVHHLCRRVDRGAIDPVHWADVWHDLCEEL